MIIPRSNRQVMPNATPLQAGDTGAGLVGAASARVGEGIQQLGEGANRLALSFKSENDKLDDFQTNLNLTKFHNDQELYSADYNANIQGDGRDHAAGLASHYDQAATQLYNSLPNNPEMRQRAQLQLEQWRGSFVAQAQAKQIAHADEYQRDATIDLAYGTFFPKITADVSSVKDALDATDAVLAGTKMSDAAKEAVRRTVGHDAFVAWLDKVGPDGAAQAKGIIEKFGASLPSSPTDVAAGHVSEAGFKALKSEEGYAPVAQWDVRQNSGGYGSKAAPGETFTPDKAEAYMRRDMAPVEKYINENVKVPLTQEQYDSLARFGYNLGADDIAKLLPDLNAGNFRKVADNMKQFFYAGGEPNRGLMARRAREAAPFNVDGPTGETRQYQEGNNAPTTTGYFVRSLSHNMAHVEDRAAKAQALLDAQARVQGFMRGEPFNPHNSDDKKLVDAVFAKDPRPDAMFKGDEGAMRSLVEDSQRLNYVPESVSQAIMGLASQKDPNARALAYRAVSAIGAKQPYAFDAAANGTALRKDAEDYSALTANQALTPQQAIAHMDEMKSPEWAAQVAARKKDVEGTKGILAGLTTADLTSAFGGGFFTRNPALSSVSGEDARAMMDYKALVEENYYRHGNVNVAKSVAATQLARMWGVSEVTGSKVLTRYPIEKQYPEVDGSHDYIAQQLTAKAKADTGKDVALSDIAPRADDRTQRELSDGKPPSYIVMYLDENGLRQTLPGRFTPNVDAAHDAVGAKFTEARTKALAPRNDLPGTSPLSVDETNKRRASVRAILDTLGGVFKGIGSGEARGPDIYGSPRK